VCYSLWYNAPTMLPAGNCPKHVELTGIINKPLLLHLVGVYIIYISLYFFRLAKQSQFNPYSANIENMLSS